MAGKFKGVVSVGVLVGMVIVALVFGSLISTVADNTLGIPGAGNSSAGNITGASWTMLQLVPLFLTIAVVLGFVVSGRRG